MQRFANAGLPIFPRCGEAGYHVRCVNRRSFLRAIVFSRLVMMAWFSSSMRTRSLRNVITPAPNGSIAGLITCAERDYREQYLLGNVTRDDIPAGPESIEIRTNRLRVDPAICEDLP